MTEEEKKAIDKLKSWKSYMEKDEDEMEVIDTISNLIEKLQKENEELKNKVVKRNNELIELDETSDKEFLTKQEVKENYIPKDKIREKIETLKKEATDRLNEGRENIFVTKMLIIDILEELLEEEE